MKTIKDLREQGYSIIVSVAFRSGREMVIGCNEIGPQTKIRKMLRNGYNMGLIKAYLTL